MSAHGQTVSVIIPTLNEVDCIASVLMELPLNVVDDVLLVDGHSTDGTPELVRSLGYRVIQQDGRGYGAAIATAFRHVTGDVAVLVDADGSYDLDDIPALLARVADGADLALGSRYLPASGSDDDTLVRYAGNKLFTSLLRMVHGVKTTDALFFYAAITRRVFESVVVRSPGFEYIVEYLIQAHRAGFAFAEVPSYERRRRACESKVNAFVDGLRILSVIARQALPPASSRVPQPWSARRAPSAETFVAQTPMPVGEVAVALNPLPAVPDIGGRARGPNESDAAARYESAGGCPYIAGGPRASVPEQGGHEPVGSSPAGARDTSRTATGVRELVSSHAERGDAGPDR